MKSYWERDYPFEVEEKNVEIAAHSNFSLRSVYSWFISLGQQIWQGFADLFSLSNEPVIREVRDRHGRTTWRVYDPISNTILRFNSPREVLIWLEERYYSLRRDRGW